jgi:lysophospholipase
MIVAMRGLRLLKRLDRMFRQRDQAVATGRIFGCVFACVLLALAGCGRKAGAPDLPHAPGSLSPRFYAPPGWTWGHVGLTDHSELRYGVASPPVVPRGAVLILPDRDEPAEVWFETANDLLARGYTVWLLESAGRGAGALDPANGALRQMIGGVIRPRGQPLVLIGQGLGSTLALRAIGETPAPGVTGAVIASPTLDLASMEGAASPEQLETAAQWATRLRAGWTPLPGDGRPRLGGAVPVGLDPKRAGLAATWRRSDPSLRPRRTTLGWVWGYDQAIRLARAASPYAGVHIPVVMPATAGDALAARACQRLPTCTLWPVPTSAPHLARDEMRSLWLQRIAVLLNQYPYRSSGRMPG